MKTKKVSLGCELYIGAREFFPMNLSLEFWIIILWLGFWGWGFWMSGWGRVFGTKSQGLVFISSGFFTF